MSRSHIFKSKADLKIIHGAGGGSAPSAPPAPVEDPDTLRSNQEGVLVDLLCEGPIQGFPNGADDDVYLSETPSSAYPGASIELRTGELDQEPFAGVRSTEVVHSVSETVLFNKPVIRSITDSNIDRVLLNLYTPRLLKVDGNNNTVGWRIPYSVGVKPTGGEWSDVNVSASNASILGGKTRSGFGWTVQKVITGANFPVQVRIRRLREDDANSKHHSLLYWTSFVEAIDANLSHPGSAMVRMTVQADKFNSIPSRAYRVQMKKVEVPSNYDALNRTYTGDWDGTFVGPTYTSNPAWCLRDLMVSTRGGMGQYITEAQVDKWSLYEIAKYCDEMVPSGKRDIYGNDLLEPRFVLNLYLQKEEEAYKVISDLSSVFRAMVFWCNGQVSWAQDRPREPGHLFSPSNVVDGLFNYARSGRRSRHTVAKVRWSDPDNFHLPAIEYVEDRAEVAKLGYIVRDVTAIGTSSRGQAIRLGRWVLRTELKEQEVVSFVTGMQGQALLPGHVFEVLDPMRSGKRWGGRIRSSSLDVVELDGPVTLDPDETYDLYVLFPDTKYIQDAANDSVSLTIPDSPPSLTAEQLRVYADLEGDGIYETEYQVQRWTPGATDTDPGTVTFIPTAGNGDTVSWQIRYPQGIWNRPVQIPAEPTEVTQLTLTSPLEDVPPPDSMWVLTQQGTAKRLYRCITIEERDNSTFEVAGLEYRESKYAEVESGLYFEDDEYPEVPDNPNTTNAAVTNIQFETELRSSSTTTMVDLVMTWSHPQDQEQRGYLVRYRINRGQWTNLLGQRTDTGMWTTKEAVIENAIPGLYEVQITAVNIFLRPSPPTAAEYTLGESNLIDFVQVSHLEINHQGPDPEFLTPDAHLSWMVSSPETSTELGDDDPENDADASLSEPALPLIREFVVRFFRPEEPDAWFRSELAPVRAGGGEILYSYGDMIQDGILTGSGKRVPQRSFRVEVYAKDSTTGNLSPAAKRVFTNPAPPAPAEVDVITAFKTGWAEVTEAGNDSDITQIKVWMSTAGANFTPALVNEVGTGSSSPIPFQIETSGVKYWIKVAVCDLFFPIGDYTPEDVALLLNVSGARSFTSGSIEGGDIGEGEVDTTHIANAAIGKAQIGLLAVDSARINDLAVTTFKIAGRAVTDMVEVTVSPFQLFDNVVSMIHVPGQWRTVASATKATVGGQVVIAGIFWGEVISTRPQSAHAFGDATDTQSANLLMAENWMRRTPKIVYRIVRDLGGPGEFVVYESGPLNMSAVGWIPLAQFTRIDAPVAGVYTYTLQLQHKEDTYEEGVLTGFGATGTSTAGAPYPAGPGSYPVIEVEAVGTRFSTNVLFPDYPWLWSDQIRFDTTGDGVLDSPWYDIATTGRISGGFERDNVLQVIQEGAPVEGASDTLANWNAGLEGWVVTSINPGGTVSQNSPPGGAQEGDNAMQIVADATQNYVFAHASPLIEANNDQGDRFRFWVFLDAALHSVADTVWIRLYASASDVNNWADWEVPLGAIPSAVWTEVEIDISPAPVRTDNSWSRTLVTGYGLGVLNTVPLPVNATVWFDNLRHVDYNVPPASIGTGIYQIRRQPFRDWNYQPSWGWGGPTTIQMDLHEGFMQVIEARR